ncbi:MAG: hypothetical protein M3680_14005, partial [Myxococcota bacterium]|nr:hypothetical protein [Myxococcota bacterium]
MVVFAALTAAACGDNLTGDRDDVLVRIGGTVSGLDGTGLVLQRAGGELRAITGNGPFRFTTEVASGDPYTVTVSTQPTAPAQTCTVTRGTGTAPSVDVTDILVECTTNRYEVSVTVTGLAGSGLVLQNNATDDLAVTADGTVTFATALASGSAFDVSIRAQPTNPTQTCTVGGGAGTVGMGDVTSVVVDCSTERFIIGGLVEGLAGTVVLQNNGGDDITVTSTGAFAFPTTITSNASYAVTVLTQPGTPSQTCIVTAGTGTVVNADISSVRVDCTTNAFTVGGTVTGLAGTGLVLQHTAGDSLAIAADGGFTFATPVTSGTAYGVTVAAQPTGPTQVCTVAAGAGTMGGANVTTVAITCTTSPFTIGGTVTGLAGTGFVLHNNGGNALPITADGAFTFTAPVASGAPFAVTIATQPSGPVQTCVVSGGTGTVGSADVTSVVVNCVVDQFTVGGTISGLAGAVVLQNNGGGDLSLTSNGTFAFTAPVASGQPYAVTVLSQPGTPSQTCTVASGTGTVTAADVASVAVTCVTNRYTVGGTASGLAGSGLVLRNNGGDPLAIALNGSFTFSTSVASGTTYAVTVAAQPTSPSQTCTVAQGTGTITTGDVTTVTVTCTVDEFTIGGTVSGLAGSGLVLQNSGGDSRTISANGTFAFATPVASGGSYAVTVLTQPSS